ncbi:hypothetical protein FOXYSP1_19584 [Fusarium oxysporum f. sp. phaseoli]
MRDFTRKSRYFRTPPKIFHDFHMWNIWKGLRGVDMEMLKPTWNGYGSTLWIHMWISWYGFEPWLHSDDPPETSRQVRDLAKHRSRPTRRKYSKIAKRLEPLEMKVTVQNAQITGLEEQMAQVR